MGLSFHNETSESSVAGSLRFAADDSNSTMGMGGISQDENLCLGPDSPNPPPSPEEVSISEERRDDEMGRKRPYPESMVDRPMESKDRPLHRQQDLPGI